MQENQVAVGIPRTATKREKRSHKNENGKEKNSKSKHAPFPSPCQQHHAS
jgi:hypothetical protein